MQSLRERKSGIARPLAGKAALLATAGLFLSLLVSPVAAQNEELSWFGYADDDMAALAYGIPDSDYAPLVFHCDNGNPEIAIATAVEPVSAVEGKDIKNIKVRLVSGQTAVEIMATEQEQEMDDLLHLEGHARLEGGLQAILTSTGTLTVTVAGRETNYPLEGAAKAAGALITACGARKASANDLELTLTNKTSLPIVGFSFSQAGVNDFDGDTFGNQTVDPGNSVQIVIAGSKDSCTFDMLAEFDEDAEHDPIAGTQNLCEKGEFVVQE